jgi:prevent-host-death family protein
METVGAYEAKTHFPKLLERAAQGQRITITKHGVPVAVLGPNDSDKNIDVTEVIRALREFRQGNCLDGLSLQEMMETGRR